MGLRRGQQPIDLLYNTHRAESRAIPTGEELLRTKRNITKAFGAGELQIAYQGS